MSGAGAGVRGPFEDERVYTLVEVAERLGYRTAKPVLKAIRDGRLVASRPASDVRVLGVDANAWWRDARLQPQPGEPAPVVRELSGSRRRRPRVMPVLQP